MLYDLTISQNTKMLRNLSQWLDMAAEFAEKKKFNIDVLLGSRLAPDQFNLTKQVQIACDHAKFAASRVTGKEAPVHEDNEKTLDEVKARIQKVIDYLATFQAGDFAGASERTVSLPRWEGKTLTASEFAIHYALPNFYFHITTAYAIMRHNGVDLGKKHFIGGLPFSK